MTLTCKPNFAQLHKSQKPNHLFSVLNSLLASGPTVPRQPQSGKSRVPPPRKRTTTSWCRPEQPRSHWRASLRQFPAQTRDSPCGPRAPGEACRRAAAASSDSVAAGLVSAFQAPSSPARMSLQHQCLPPPLLEAASGSSVLLPPWPRRPLYLAAGGLLGSSWPRCAVCCGESRLCSLLRCHGHGGCCGACSCFGRCPSLMMTEWAGPGEAGEPEEEGQSVL